MAVWLVRAGSRGQREATALENGIAIIDWRELPDLSQFKTRENLHEQMKDTYQHRNPRTITNWLAQLWAFKERMKPGDLVVLPLKSQGAIATGEVTGAYSYQSEQPEDARHTRPVKWHEAAIPRSKIDQDILFSLGASQTVCQIKRNDAEARIRAIVEGKQLPSKGVQLQTSDEEGEEGDTEFDLEGLASEQISQEIQRRFAGHGFSDLVSAVLTAEGYQTEVSPPGADGGVDILAGRGTMGFDHPLLCVQVKSGAERQDVKVLRELKGVMKDFGADHGLFVSWGGFKDSVYKEARKSFFEIRLWSADDLIERLLQIYEKLPEDLRAELPLKRVWTLVREE